MLCCARARALSTTTKTTSNLIISAGWRAEVAKREKKERIEATIILSGGVVMELTSSSRRVTPVVNWLLERLRQPKVKREVEVER